MEKMFETDRIIFFNSLSLECESIAVTSLSITTQENKLDRFAILLSYCLGFIFLVFVLNTYNINIHTYTVDVPSLK